MKIVHIHHHYWPVVGGLENVVKALAEGMAKLRKRTERSRPSGPRLLRQTSVFYYSVKTLQPFLTSLRL
jgi:hypothetical protein